MMPKFYKVIKSLADIPYVTTDVVVTPVPIERNYKDIGVTPVPIERNYKDIGVTPVPIERKCKDTGVNSCIFN